MYYHLNKSQDGIDILSISIYDKSDRSTIKKHAALKMLKEVLFEHQQKINKRI
jgi:hypothetical protein